MTTYESLLEAAKLNLEMYKASGDENAIRAGERMVKEFEKIVNEPVEV